MGDSYFDRGQSRWTNPQRAARWFQGAASVHPESFAARASLALALSSADPDEGNDA